MAGLIGFALGTALNWNKQKNQAEQAGREKMADMTLSMAAQGHPEVLQTPEAQKMISGVYGKDMLGIVQSMAERAQQTQQQFQKDLSGPSSSQPPTSGLPTAAGMSSGSMIGSNAPPLAPAQGAPQSPPMMGTAPTAPQTPAATPAPANFDNPQTLQDWQNKETYLSNLAGDPRYSDPAHQSIIKQHLDIASRNLSEMRSLGERQSEHADTLAQSKQVHEDSQANVRISQALQAQSLAQSAQAHADSLAQARQFNESNNQFKQLTANMNAAQAAEATRTHFASQTANLQARIDKLATQTPDQAALSIPNINGDMKTLKAQADKAGIDYDSSMFTPLKVGKVPGKYWGTNPGIVRDEAPAAAAPTGATDGVAPVIRKDTAGKSWKLNSAGTGWEPAE